MSIMTSSALRLAAAALVGCSALLTACVPISPSMDSRFGEAVQQTRAVQTLNPDASRNQDPVAGIDGESARNSIVVYRNTFKEPPRTFNVLNIGGSELGAGGP